MFRSQKKTGEKPGDRKRKKRNLRKYGQAKLQHSHMGIFSCCYAVAGAVLLLLSMGNAFLTSGQAPGVIGGLGIAAVLLAVLGFQAAFKGLRERERNYLTCKLGGGANAILFLVLIMIYVSGFMQ